MTRTTNWLWLLFLIFFLAACRPKQMDRQHLNQYVRDEGNGLRKRDSSTNGIKIDVMMIRPELLFDGSKNMKKISDSLRYFMISFNKNDREALLQAGDQSTYSTLVENLSLAVTKYCRLIVDKKDTIQINNYSFSNGYGTAPANNLLLIFKAPTPQKEYDLELDELGLNIGTRKYTFKEEDITNLDNIKIN